MYGVEIFLLSRVGPLPGPNESLRGRWGGWKRKPRWRSSPRFISLRIRDREGPIRYRSRPKGMKKREKLRYYKSSRAQSSLRISRRNRSGSLIARGRRFVERGDFFDGARARPHIRSQRPPAHPPSRPAPLFPLVINLQHVRVIIITHAFAHGL